MARRYLENITIIIPPKMQVVDSLQFSWWKIITFYSERLIKIIIKTPKYSNSQHNHMGNGFFISGLPLVGMVLLCTRIKWVKVSDGN